MKLISKKIMLSLGVCAGLLTAGVSAQSYAQAPAAASAGTDMASAMAAFDKLTPEQQKEQIAQSRKMVETQMDAMIKNASTPEQKKQFETAKEKALEQIDAMAKMTPEERKALIEKSQKAMQSQLQNVTPEQLKKLTPEQRAAFEKLKQSQGVK